MDITLIEILGYIKNDTEKLGKAFLFNIMYEKYNFDCILFIHDDYNFISLNKEDIHDKDLILKNILNKYTIKELLEA